MTRLIPNELLKSVGQLGNKFSIIESFLNILNICTKPGSRALNLLKKLLNVIGERSGTSIITTTPILPRHPKDPVDGLLEVGRAVQQRTTKADYGTSGANTKAF
ncbi:diguanylate cyclase [Babesia caballi]|uniref:Diguanylate cyclase n=1 Tax=Babesia caballi TaxID=5871 RepID=A0AAV4LYR0_BABCB|nr:diguanylate cyclase [Babesia caballi]